MTVAPITVNGLNHYYGERELRRQALFDISVEIREGEIVILTGPSGSGKSTLLTLIGALRSAQEGSIRLLGHELQGSSEQTLVAARQHIGYIFQAHNLLEALTALQNVQVPLQVHNELDNEDIEKQAKHTLEAVGLGDKLQSHPSELSGGERQRVAIARALVVNPKILLADEATASLDKQTGRTVINLIKQLAQERGVTVVLVTHDNRILDVADRILTLEDGRLISLMNAVTSDTHHMLHTLARDIRKGEFVRKVEKLNVESFLELMEEITGEMQHLLDIVDLVQGDTFGSVCDQFTMAFIKKLIEIIGTEHVILTYIDPETQNLWKFDECEHGKLIKIETPIKQGGIAGLVASSGEAINVTDIDNEPRYNPLFDSKEGYNVRNLLCMPVKDSQDHTYAVVTLLNKRGEDPFSATDERKLKEFTKSIGLILESWWRMTCDCRTQGFGNIPTCCSETA
jgi:putative ABC transport system ATP-binding protein